MADALNNIVKGLFDRKRLHQNVGSGWKLFFYLCLNMDEENEFTGTYVHISKQLGVNVSTLKVWRKYLVSHDVVRSFSGGNVVHFKMLEPYRSLLALKVQENSAATIIPDIVQMVETKLEKMKKQNIGAKVC